MVLCPNNSLICSDSFLLRINHLRATMLPNGKSAIDLFSIHFVMLVICGISMYIFAFLLLTLFTSLRQCAGLVKCSKIAIKKILSKLSSLNGRICASAWMSHLPFIRSIPICPLFLCGKQNPHPTSRDTMR